MKTLLILLVTVTVLVTGCASTLSQKATTIIEADEKMVTNCNFIGSFEGDSGWSGSIGIQNAKKMMSLNNPQTGERPMLFFKKS